MEREPSDDQQPQAPPRTPHEGAARRRQRQLAQELGEAERRMQRARERHSSVWFGLGTFGLVGWSVAVPTLIGLALGVWLDGHYPARFSWTLTLLITGIVLGCLNAWYWLSREREEIDRERSDDADE